MINKSISVTDQQNSWIKSQVKTGHYGNDSELIRELIRERQLREQEDTSEIKRIRALLIEAEKNGFTSQTGKEILEEVKLEMRLNDKL